MRLCDVVSVGSRLRAADLKELTHDGRKSQFAGLFEGLRDIHQSYTIEVAGSPEGLFGVGPAGYSERAGMMWMVGTTTLIEDASYIFAKSSYWVVEQMLRNNPQYAYVHNYVHDENTIAVAWLQRLGFTLANAYTRHGMNFLLLIKDNPYYKDV